jgi:hypothetical protein
MNGMDGSKAALVYFRTTTTSPKESIDGNIWQLGDIFETQYRIAGGSFQVSQSYGVPT